MIYFRKGRFTVKEKTPPFTFSKRILVRTKVEKLLLPLEFHYRDKTHSTHVTIEWIFKLLDKTKAILEVYDLTVTEYSEKSVLKCITTLLENVEIDPSVNSSCVEYSLLYYGATVSCKKESVRQYWKRHITSERASFSFLISCLTTYHYEIDNGKIDFDTAEHLLAIYNVLFIILIYIDKRINSSI